MTTADKIEWPEDNPLFEVQWRAVSEGLVGNGIKSSGDLKVTSTATDLEISVAAGTAIYNNSESTLGAATPLTLSGGDADDRWDLVYFDTSTGSPAVREGTAATYPEPPDLQADELLLAVVYVPSGATDVPDSQILNWRATAQTGSLVYYSDSTGTYSVDNVADALDELQEAAQISSYPLANSDLANSTITLTAGAGLVTTNASIGLGGSATVDVGTGPLLQTATDQVDVNTGRVFEGDEGGSVGNDVQGIVDVEQLPDGETARVDKATLVSVADVVDPVADNVDLELVTFDDSSSGYTSQATLISGDGSTLHNSVSGSPLGSYTNSSGGEQTVGVVVDNQSGANQEVYASFEGALTQ